MLAAGSSVASGTSVVAAGSSVASGASVVAAGLSVASGASVVAAGSSVASGSSVVGAAVHVSSLWSGLSPNELEEIAEADVGHRDIAALHSVVPPQSRNRVSMKRKTMEVG